jgi:hypothetical protein
LNGLIHVETIDLLGSIMNVVDDTGRRQGMFLGFAQEIVGVDQIIEFSGDEDDDL